MRNGNATLSSIQFGIVAGLATAVLYPLLIFASLPDVLSVVLAALLGPLLGFASWGLRELLTLDKRTTWSDLGMLCNALAVALFTAMVLVQLAVKMDATGTIDNSFVAIWLGLDVAWDTYIGLGTLFFSIAMFRHPRLGPIVGGVGAVLAILLLSLNYYTFPTPPAEAELFDIGPFVGLWYTVVTLMVWRALKWARTRVVEA